MPSLSNIANWFHPRNIFGSYRRVGRLQYFVVGVVLALIKYAVEAAVIGATTNRFYSPLDFVNPFLTGREKFLALGPDWLGWAWLLWTFPFLVVCVLMSLRRCLDANISPWTSFLTLVPILNLAAMPLFASLPSGDAKETDDPDDNPYAATIETNVDPIKQRSFPGWQAGLIGLGIGVIYLLVTVLFSVYLIGSYGTALFFGAPVVTCAVAAYTLNRGVRVSLSATIGHSILVLFVASLGFLALGIEGGICILMAMPLFIPMAIFGAIVGYAIASSANPGQDRTTGMMGSLFVLPLIASAETWIEQSPILETKSEVRIEAPIEEVWNMVIAFPEIKTEPRGLFAWGVAYPIRATIDGHGVGATRYCEFTTGTFVEPITVWNKPTRLAFDVTDQPEPMSELSPYHSIHPPHLDASFRSSRGEFRLVEESPAVTILQGSTWYQLDIGPRSYWRLWTDRIVHRIHQRVLEHIKQQCENVDGFAPG
jgi:hypothetical protein